MANTALTAEINRIAEAVGLDALGIAPAVPFDDYPIEGSPRRDPRLSLPGARALVVAGVYIGGMALPAWEDPHCGRTSRLYLSGYFLDVVSPLAPLAAALRAAGFQAVVCDGGQSGGSVLPLKPAAVRAGLGWQGKHSLLISKTFGSFLALGGIITDAPLAVNRRVAPNRCKRCDLCQTACPVGALETPHVLSVKRCLSYQLQTEALSPEALASMGNRVGDCEICQTVCPWNRKHLDHPLPTRFTLSFQKQAAAWERRFRLAALADLSEDDYGERFGLLKTQIPFAYFRRNVRLAIANAQAHGVRTGQERQGGP